MRPQIQPELVLAGTSGYMSGWNCAASARTRFCVSSGANNMSTAAVPRFDPTGAHCETAPRLLPVAPSPTRPAAAASMRRWARPLPGLLGYLHPRAHHHYTTVGEEPTCPM